MGAARGLNLRDDNPYNPSVVCLMELICEKCVDIPDEWVPLDAFMQAVMEMKGGADALDLHIVHWEVTKVQREVTKVQREVAKVQSVVAQMCEHMRECHI